MIGTAARIALFLFALCLGIAASSVTGQGSTAKVGALLIALGWTLASFLALTAALGHLPW